MATRCCRYLGFGELLSALAVIVALVALLLPVLARARSAARMAVCLGNIRSIAKSVRMYLDDNDGHFPPREANASTLAYFDARPGGGGDAQWNPATVGSSPYASVHCKAATSANPYLRWPVILDTYLPSRDVWRCPDAVLEDGAHFINGSADWEAHLRDTQGQWGLHSAGYVCPGNTPCWPAGWGGAVTDTLTQHRYALPETSGGDEAGSMFIQSIGTTEVYLSEWPAKPNIIRDPSVFVVCADGGATTNAYCAGTLAYPDLCGLECAASADWSYGADWQNCPWSQTCGAIPAMLTDVNLRRAHARHFGGVNIGFLDGHAQWFDSEEVIRLSPTQGNPEGGKLQGYGPWGPTKDAPGYDATSGAPTLH